MKKNNFVIVFLFLLSLFCVQSSLFSQKLKTEDVPTSVMNALEYEYPGVKVSAWELIENQFVANFKIDGLASKAYFSNAGEWVKTLMPIPRKELPTAIIQYVEKEYPNFVIPISALQQKPGEKTHYYLEVKKDGIGQASSTLSFTDRGELMQRNDPPGFTLEEPKPQAASPKSQEKPSSDKSEKSSTKQKSKDEPQKQNVEINESSIPPIVSKTLKKKASRPENLKWYRVDSFYVAKCTAQGKENEIFITPDGVWEKTIIQLPEEAVTGNMQKHLKSYYKGYRFAAARKEMRADKNDRNYVEIYEKKNWKDKFITTIIFDKSGKLLKTIDPDYTMGQNKKSEEDTDLDSYYAKIDEERPLSGTKIRSRDLPTDLQSYVSLNYPSYRYKLCTLVEDEDLGSIYKIEIKEEGIGLGSETLYFSKIGKFLKREGAENENDFAIQEEENEPNIEIPEKVLTTFKAKYPRVVEPEWSLNEENHYQVSFNGTRGKTICVYDAEGTILETYSALSPDNLTQTIANYIKKNAKGAKVLEYYTVKKADRKTYYQVIIQTKKTKEIQTLWFTNTGKIVE